MQEWCMWKEQAKERITVKDYSDIMLTLSRNWLNSPIKEIEILDNPEKTNIKEYDNQQNLGYFKSGSTKQDLNIFMGK